MPVIKIIKNPGGMLGAVKKEGKIKGRCSGKTPGRIRRHNKSNVRNACFDRFRQLRGATQRLAGIDLDFYPAPSQLFYFLRKG